MRPAGYRLAQVACEIREGILADERLLILKARKPNGNLGMWQLYAPCEFVTINTADTGWLTVRARQDGDWAHVLLPRPTSGGLREILLPLAVVEFLDVLI